MPSTCIPNSSLLSPSLSLSFPPSLSLSLPLPLSLSRSLPLSLSHSLSLSLSLKRADEDDGDICFFFRNKLSFAPYTFAIMRALSVDRDRVLKWT